MYKITSLAVIGSGSWATALVKVFAENKIMVTWVVRSPAFKKFVLINHHNPSYLSNCRLDMTYIKPLVSIEEGINENKHIVFAVPSSHLVNVVDPLNEESLQGKYIYTSIKGMVTENHLTPSRFLTKKFNLTPDDIAVISGPSHAEELALSRKTYLTIAGKNEEVIKSMGNALQSSYLTINMNNDPEGVEYASIIKNVLGIASGMVSGLNYGENFLAVVMCNALKEIKNFLQAIDGNTRDIFHSVYFGDLLVTAYSGFSRNKNFGNLIGRGYGISVAADKINMAIEGLPATKGIYDLSIKLAVNMPIITTVYRILYKQSSACFEFKLLENNLK